MATIDASLHHPRATSARAAASARSTNALRTLVRRRFALNIRTPRELVVPLLTPVLFALIIAPALADQIPTVRGIDYMSSSQSPPSGCCCPSTACWRASVSSSNATAAPGGT